MESIIEKNTNCTDDTNCVVQLSPTDFYAKQIVYGAGDSVELLNKIAMLVGLEMVEKYGLDVRLSNTVASSLDAVISNISIHNSNFFAKAFYHKSAPSEPVGIMFGSYIPDIKIAVSSILYVKPEFRMYNLESRLIDNFTYWSKHIKHAIKTFIEKVEEV